eukprot:7313766-Pyramimonas_sp.AAC.1
MTTPSTLEGKALSETPHVAFAAWPRGDKDALAAPAKAQNRQGAYGQGLLLSVSQRRPWRHAIPWRADSVSFRSAGRDAGRSSRT